MKFVLLYLLTVPCWLTAQIDFNDYQTIQSSGQIPTDFTAQTYEKIEEGLTVQRDGMSRIEQREFLEKTGYAIDDLLHSGLVVYGDELSNYISAIADDLLSDNPQLRSELRFYTLKSNVTNAFSTDQGIIFVTTGLLGQLANEAQLAYILAHEISHYTEKHVVESFNWSRDQRFSHNWISQMSVYKKEREFEADKLAIDMYRKAGYSKDELVSTFDVLLYSYLPFDEIKVAQSYFSSDQMYLPPFMFPEKEYEIKADEHEDDSNSTHPNIAKRKEAVKKELEAVTGTWEQAKFKQPEETFVLIRDIARFENVRTSILNTNYGDAVYSIYLLEQKFPNSMYLKRMKAQSWLGLYQYEKLGQISKVIKATKEYEGFSADVHYMIRKFNRSSLTTMSVRQIYDIYQANSTDPEIKAIYSFLLNELGRDDKFNLSDYSALTFQQAVDSSLALIEKQSLDSLTLPLEVTTDTLTVEEPAKKKTKYDRIKTKTAVSTEIVVGESIDSIKYYLYGLSDIITDSSFLKNLEDERAIEKERQNRRDAFDALSSREQKKILKKNQYNYLEIGCKELIVVEPKVYSYKKSGVDNVKSEQLEETFSEALSESAQLADISLYSIDSRSLDQNGSKGFNERTALLTCLRQIGNNNYKVNPFPVDFSLLRELEGNYGTSNVLFTIVEHSFNPNIRAGYFLYTILFPPALPFMAATYIPIQLMQANKTEITLVMLDIKTGEVIFGDSHYLNEPVKKLNLGAHMYDLFMHLKTNPR